MLLNQNTEAIQANYECPLLNKLLIILWQSLFVFMIVTPRIFQSIKFVLLVNIFLFSIILMTIEQKKIKINRVILTFILLNLFYSLFSGYHGIIKHNPGAMGFLRVNVIYYVFYFLLIVLNNITIEFYDKIIKLILYASNIISIYSLLFVLVKINIWPETLFYDFDATSNIGFHDGYLHLTNTNLSMMIFIVPFLAGLYFNNYKIKMLFNSHILFSLIFSLIVVFISGRRILWITSSFSILYYVIIKYRHIKHYIYKILTMFILLFLLFYSFNYFDITFTYEAINNRLLSAFDKYQETARFDQIQSLLNGFFNNPVFGVGAGLGVSDVIRSSISPWSYEMSYHLALYNSGLFGFFFFGASHCYLLFSLYKEIAKGSNLAESLFIAYIMVLFANATNPYFSSSFDFLWFIFFPLMYFSIDVSEFQKKVS